MARINRYHIAYLEELLDVDIDTFYLDADPTRWAELELKPGETTEWEYSGRVHFKVTRRGTHKLPPHTHAGEPEDMKNLTWRSRVKLWLGGQEIDIQKVEELKQNQDTLHDSYKKSRYE